MPWVNVLDNYTGAVKATSVALLGGRDYTAILIAGDLGGASGEFKATISTPDGDQVVDMYRQRPDTQAWLQWVANEDGALNRIPCNGIKGLSVDFVGGTGLVGLSIWIRAMAETT